MLYFDLNKMKLLQNDVFLFCAILLLPVLIHARNGGSQNCNFTHPNTILKTSELILSKSMEVSALGRVANLGDFYDARSDSFVEISLFTTDLPNNAIHSTDNAYSSIDYVTAESVSEKMEKLRVQGSLSVSFLCGMVTASGSGKYLNEDKKNSKSAKTSLIYSVRTVRDDFRIFSKSSKNLIDSFLLENVDATHVVVGIDWGADVVLSLEETNTDSSNFKEIQEKLEASLDLVAQCVSNSAEVNSENFDVEKSRTFSLYLNGDIIPNSVPQTINESISFMRNIQDLIKNENSGKGKILNYILMPLHTVQKVFDIDNSNTSILREMDQELINQLIQIFQEMKDSELQINDAYHLFKTWSFMVPENEFEEISEIKSTFDSFMNNFRVRLGDAVVQFRSGEREDDALCELISSYKNSDYTPSKINNFLDKFSLTIHKTELLNLLQRHNSMFIDRRTDKYKILANNYEREIRIISTNLSMNISSPVVSQIIDLLDIESRKKSGKINYYIEDTNSNTLEVNAFLQGKVIDPSPPKKNEYILLTDKNGAIIIINPDSLEPILNYSLNEVRYSILAVVDDMLYNIDTMNGIITSTAVKNIMSPEKKINWTQVCSFQSESNWIRNSVAVNETLIYFVTHDGVLYVYDTTSNSKIITGFENVTVNDTYASLIVVNNVLYIYKYGHFYSYDGINLDLEINNVETNFPGLFQLGNNVCRVGGNNRDVNPDLVSCYNPEDKTWNVTTHINEARWNPAVVSTESKTYIFGGNEPSVVGDGDYLKSVEVLDHKTKIWTRVPNLITGPYPQAIVFYF